MKINQTQDIVFGNSVSAKKAFTISASAKAFQILSSGIYKYKIDAVAREIICNANDAHIVSGTTDKFYIRVPSSIDPRFEVRDYGTGLSEEDVMELYTTYFASTKTDCNNQTGAFGLGAKSPFAYTDTFNITSYFDGRVKIYSAMIVSGEPVISKEYDGPMKADDKTGMKISVPVKQDDIWEWECKISKMLRPFDPDTFELSYELGIDHIAPQYGTKNGGYSVSSGSGISAIYGNISYDIDLDVINESTNLLKHTYKHIDIWFPLGELMPQPSREQLQKDDYTLENIKKALSDIDNKYIKNASIELNKIECRRAAARHVRKQYNSSIIEELDKCGVTYKGESIKGISNIDDSDTYRSLSRRLHNSLIYSCALSTPTNVTLVDRPIYSGRRFLHYISLFGYLCEKVTILVNDTKGKLLRNTLKGLCISSKYSHVVYVEPEQLDEYIYLFESVMGNDPIEVIKISELEDIRKLVPGYGVPRPRETRPATPNVKLRKYTGAFWSTQELYLTATEVRELKGHYIGIVYDDYYIGDSDRTVIAEHRIDTYKICNELGITEFYEVRTSAHGNVKKSECKCLVTEYINHLMEQVNTIGMNNLIYMSGLSNLSSKVLNNSEYANLFTSNDESTKSIVYNVLNARRWGPFKSSEWNKFIAKFEKASTEFVDNLNAKVEKFAEEQPIIMMALLNPSNNETFNKQLKSLIAGI